MPEMAVSSPGAVIVGVVYISLVVHFGKLPLNPYFLLLHLIILIIFCNAVRASIC